MANILIIEDNTTLNNGILLALKDDKYVFSQVYTLKEAKEILKENDFQLILLDLNLPDGNGLELLKELRKTLSVPVIILTANDTELDIVTGLELGANDYITKPFSLMVLRARVKAGLRQTTPAKKNIYIFHTLSFDFDKMEFYKDKSPIELSKTEQKLLRLLVLNKGITLTRDYLIDHVWTDGAEYVDENALSVAIKRLRDKLEENPAKPVYIKTVYGVGYQWAVS